jgi:C4-dicarboxylate transporter DctQ subunit
MGIAMLLRLLDRLEEFIISLLIGAATLLIFAAVVQRYSLGHAVALMSWGRSHDWPTVVATAKAVFGLLNSVDLTWAQEVCVYMFVWMAKFGAAYGVRTGIHVGVDVALNRLNTPSERIVVLFGLMAGAVFTFIVGTLGARFVWHMAHTEQVSPDLEIPMWIVYLAVPLGSYLMCFRFLQVAFSFLRTGELPHHDHGHVEGIEDETPTVPGIVGVGTHEHPLVEGGSK